MSRRRQGCSRVLGLLSAATALCGCAVGPNYHPPAMPTPPAFSEAGNAGTDPLSRPVPGQADLSRWWLQFDDPMLNWLIDQALAQNLNLQVATARLRQAREAEITAESTGLPQANASATVARLNDNASSSPLSAILGAGGTGAGGAAAGTGAAGGADAAPSHLNLYAADFDEIGRAHV